MDSPCLQDEVRGKRCELGESQGPYSVVLGQERRRKRKSGCFCLCRSHECVYVVRTSYGDFFLVLHRSPGSQGKPSSLVCRVRSQESKLTTRIVNLGCICLALYQRKGGLVVKWHAKLRSALYLCKTQTTCAACCIASAHGSPMVNDVEHYLCWLQQHFAACWSFSA